MPPERPFLGDGVRKLGHAKFSHAPAFDTLDSADHPPSIARTSSVHGFGSMPQADRLLGARRRNTAIPVPGTMPAVRPYAAQRFA